MKLSEILESLNNPLPYKQLVNSPQLLRYGFVFENITFFIDFDVKSAELNGNNIKIATVTFYEVDEHGNPVYEQTNKHRTSLRLFSTVKAVIDINMNRFNYIIFTAMEEGSRVGLYYSMVKKHASNYKVHMVQTKLGSLYIIGHQLLDNDTKQQLSDAALTIIQQKL